MVPFLFSITFRTRIAGAKLGAQELRLNIVLVDSTGARPTAEHSFLIDLNVGLQTIELDLSDWRGRKINMIFLATGPASSRVYLEDPKIIVPQL